jgi:hypothetical protein
MLLSTGLIGIAGLVRRKLRAPDQSSAVHFFASQVFLVLLD